MVDLPSYPRRLTTLETPKSSVTSAEIASPYRSLANGLDGLGEGLSDVAEPLAEQAGYRSVTKDEAGNIQVDRLPIVGKAGVAYSRAVKVRALAEADTVADREMTDLREKYRNDPAGFEEAAKAFRDRKVDQITSAAGEAVGSSLRKSIDNSINQNYAGLLNRKQSLDLRRSAEAIESRQKTLGDELEVLARRGGANTPEYREKLSDFDALQDEKVNNPLFAYPREKADLEREAVITRAQGAAVHEQMERVYRERGYNAARDYLRSTVKDIGGSLRQADKIERSGLAWLRTEEAGLRGEKDAISREWAAAKGQVGTLGNDVLVDMETRARALGSFRVAEDIATQRNALEITRSLRNLPEDDRLRISRTGIATGPLADRIVGAESNGNANAGNPNSTALGAGQFVAGTWLDLVKRTRPDLVAGKTDEQILALRTDKALSREMVAQYAGENREKLTSAGVRSDDAALYLAHFLGPGDAIKVLQAAPGTPLQGLVQPTSIAANQKIFDRNPTAGDIQRWAASKVGVQAEGELVDLSRTRTGLAALGMLKKEMAAALPNQIADLRNRISRGETLAPEDISRLGEKVSLLGKPEQQREVAELAARAELGQAFETLSAPQRQEVIDRWNQRVKAGGTALESDMAAQLRTADKQISDAYKSDPYGAFYRYGGGKPLPLIDWSNPDQAALIVDQKRAQQSHIRASQNIGSFSVLRPEEAQGLRSALASGDANTVSGAFAVLGRLDDEQFAATFGDGVVKDGIAGAMRSTDPAKYTAVMSSLDRVYARAPQTFTDTMGKDAWNELKTWQSVLRYADPKTLMAERTKALDPQVVERRQKNEQSGRTEAGKKSVDEVVKGFNTSWFGPTALAPVDGLTRDTLMTDYQQVFGRRYADTLDSDKAHAEAMEFLKTKWSRSEVNGGKLMLRAPETVYPAIDGSHDWMAKKIEADLTTVLGPRTVQTPVLGPGGAQGTLAAPNNRSWDYTLVSDRESEADALAGRPVSYVVLTRDNRKTMPKWDVVKDGNGKEMRYRFDSAEGLAASRANFEAERKRILTPEPGLANKMSWVN